jgi:hypothetical protein
MWPEHGALTRRLLAALATCPWRQHCDCERSAKCEVRSAKCEVRSAKCEVRSAKCEVRRARGQGPAKKKKKKSTPCRRRAPQPPIPNPPPPIHSLNPRPTHPPTDFFLLTFFLVRFRAFLGKGSSKTPQKCFCKKSTSKKNPQNPQIFRC